jgi:hypothetical protein
VFDNLIVFVNQRDAALQVGNNDHAGVLEKMAWQAETLDKIDMLPVEREALQACVAAVGDCEYGVASAHIYPNSMRLLQLASF